MTQAIQGHMGVAQLDGNPIDLNAGAAGAGTQRVIEASDSPLVTALTAATSFSRVSAGVTEDKVAIKASAGTLKSLYLSNSGASPAYYKLYNKATAPAVASDVPVLVYLIPAGVAQNVAIPPEGITFATGIAAVMVTGSANTDATEVPAGEIIVSGSYK